MIRRPRENRLHFCYRQPKIGRDFRLIDASLPILNDVIDWHPSTLKHGAATLDAKLHFD
jgi:hypothetical protein